MAEEITIQGSLSRYGRGVLEPAGRIIRRTAGETGRFVVFGLAEIRRSMTPDRVGFRVPNGATEIFQALKLLMLTSSSLPPCQKTRSSSSFQKHRLSSNL